MPDFLKQALLTPSTKYIPHILQNTTDDIE